MTRRCTSGIEGECIWVGNEVCFQESGVQIDQILGQHEKHQRRLQKMDRAALTMANGG
jgi:hypothetical protein